MNRLGEWWRRLWYLLNRNRFEEALRQEMDAHRSMMGNARRFGNTLRLREEARDVWGWRWLDILVRDVRLSLRALRRTPGYTIVTVCSIAVGLSLTAVTAVAVNAYLIRSLPYDAADRLYRVRYAPPGPWEPRGVSALDWDSVADVVEFPIASVAETYYLSDREFSQSTRGLRVGRGFVAGLGVRAVLGRPLGEIDFAATAVEHSALIGYALWRDRYGSDPGIVGRIIHVDAEGGGRVESLRIVGVLSRDFYYGRDSRETVDFMVPLTSTARTYMVRLRRGVPVALAEQRITEAVRSVASGLPADWSGVQLFSARELYVAELRPVLAGVTVACALVLLIVAANVAVLMLLRTLRRQKEFAILIALGSGHRHLARILLIESLLVCGAGGAIAVAMARLTLEGLAPAIETHLGRPAPGGAATIAVDATVLGAVGAAGLLMAFAISFLSLLMPGRGRLGELLRREGPGSTSSRTGRPARSALIATEVAGTLVLLVGCGLMVRSLVGMLTTDLGFDPERLVRGRVVLRGADYPDAEAFARFYRGFTERLSAATNAPVVFASWPPFDDLPTLVVEAEGREYGLTAGAIGVGAGYFTAVGIALRGGRDFASGDESASAPVAVISETLARRLWADGSPLGRQVRAVEQIPDGRRVGPWRTVVGVAADVRQAYGDSELSDIYVPMVPTSRFGSFYIRTDQPPSALLPAIRSVAAGIDLHAMVDPPRTVRSQNRQLAGATFLSRLLGALASVAMFLALLGIYGVTAYAVQQRERETAIRMALGAESRAVVWMFVKEIAIVLFAGVTVGALLGTGAARVLETQLHGIRAFDVPTLVVSGVLLVSAGMLATWWPARRASLRDPVDALKDVQ